MARPEYEAACMRVGEAVRGCCEAARSSIDQSCTEHWPRQGAPWVDLAAALERFADSARDSGQPPERMITRLKVILDETLPRDDLLAELRDIAVSFSIEAYFKPDN